MAVDVEPLPNVGSAVNFDAFIENPLSSATPQVPEFLVQTGPSFGLFTGMRLGEIIQLRVADVKTTDGIVYFDVSSTLNEDDGVGETFKEPVLCCTKLTKPASQMPLRKSAGKKPSTVRDRFGLDEQSITEPRLLNSIGCHAFERWSDPHRQNNSRLTASRMPPVVVELRLLTL